MAQLLLVDDEPDIRLVGEIALGEVGGHAVRCANGGEQALAMAMEIPPDLILLDVMMPGLDGPATLQRLRAEPATAAVPVVFLTARLDANTAHMLMKLGAVACIAKPFDPFALVTQVDALLRSLAAATPAALR